MTTQRGRPRTFDEGKALEQAMALFWERGYPGTSYSDLCAATGLNKPSLYAAFGNKEAMFLTALDRYRAQNIQPAIAALEAEPDVKIAVSGLIRSMIDRFCVGPGGCMIATNAACRDAPDVPSEVAQALSQTGSETSVALTARLTRAVSEGQLPPGTDIPALVGFVVTVIQGLAGRAKSGIPRAALEETVDVAMRAWPA